MANERKKKNETFPTLTFDGSAPNNSTLLFAFNRSANCSAIFFSIYCCFCWFVALLWSHDKVISSIPIILLNWFCSFCLNSLFILLSIVFKHKTFLFWTFKAKRQFWFDSPIFRLLIYLSFFTSLWILKNDAKMHLKLWIIHINIQYALNGHCHLHTTLTSRQINKFRCEKQREKVVSFSLYLERKKKTITKLINKQSTITVNKLA